MIIVIDGIGEVEVDDAFKNLTKTQQNIFVDQIREQVRAGAKNKQDADKPVEKQRGRAFAQGVFLGFADELEAAIRNPVSALGSALGLSEGKSYKENLDVIRKKLDSYRSANPLEALASEMAGAGVTTLGLGALTAGAGGAATAAATSSRLAPLVARTAALGAGEGAIAGFGAGEGGFSERAKTAATGAAIGGALGTAAPLAVQQGGKLVRRVGDTLGVGGQKRADAFAERKVLENLDRDNLTPDTALKSLKEAQDLGIEDITIADLGENLRGSGWRAQIVPNKQRQKTIDQFDERKTRQAEQITEQAKTLSNTTEDTGLTYLDNLTEKVQRQARPAYKKAYEVELDAAPFASMAKSKVIQDAYKKAVDIADIDPDFDISNMPKDLSKFFGDEMKGGGYVGMPTEVAHEIKKGLDVLIENESEAITGKLTKRGAALNKLKNTWNREIIKQNDAYRIANEQFADNARLKDAFKSGFDFTKISEQELVKKVSKMSAPEKEALRVGLVSQIEELASKTGDATNFVKTVFGTPRKRAALRLAFDNSEQFARFEKAIKFQVDKMKTTRKVTGGSETVERKVQLDDGGMDASSVLNVGTQAFLGNIPGAAMSGAQRAASRLQGLNEKSAGRMSQMLFETDPRMQQGILNQLQQRQISDAERQRRLLRRPEVYSGFLGATSGLLAGRD